MKRLIVCVSMVAIAIAISSCSQGVISGEPARSPEPASSTRYELPEVDRDYKMGDSVAVGFNELKVLGSESRVNEASGVAAIPTTGYRFHMVVVEMLPSHDQEVCGEGWPMTRVYDAIGDPYKPEPLGVVPSNPACGSIIEAESRELITLIYEVPRARTINLWGVTSTEDTEVKTVSLPVA